MKIRLHLASTSAAKKVKTVQVPLLPEDKEIIKELRTYLTSKKLKAKLVASSVNKSVNIVPDTKLTALQSEKLKTNFPLLVFILKAKRTTTSTSSYYTVVKLVEEVIQPKLDPKEAAVLILRKQASEIGTHSKQLHNDLNLKSKTLKKVFGYWREDPNKEKSKFPFPVAVEIAGYDKQSFMSDLHVFMKQCKVNAYRGSSPNRWTKSSNGSREYVHPSGWIFPEGTIYYLTRGVPPTQEFYKVVTGKSNSKLPSQTNYSIK